MPSTSLYFGSADWMPRNFDRRIEVVTPVDDREHRRTIRSLLEQMLLDNRQAWELQADGTYRQRQPGNEPVRGTHQMLLDLYRETGIRLEGTTGAFPVMRP